MLVKVLAEAGQKTVERRPVVLATSKAQAMPSSAMKHGGLSDSWIFIVLMSWRRWRGMNVISAWHNLAMSLRSSSGSMPSGIEMKLIEDGVLVEERRRAWLKWVLMKVMMKP